MTSLDEATQELIKCYTGSPQPSFKVTNYFRIYAELFRHLRGTHCTFVETGILNGGSLFMWRSWLGEKARIVGVDLNPAAEKWRDHGFEIHIGDQGDPEFWRRTFGAIGGFDALLDDGGHQSFQQIVTVSEALRANTRPCVIAIEDTCTSFMREFSRHRHHSFLEYAKDSTDNLLIKTNHFFPGQFPDVGNAESVELFGAVHSIQFFAGIVAFKVDPRTLERPQLVWNHRPERNASDFRYEGATEATVVWPDPFTKQTILVRGGKG